MNYTLENGEEIIELTENLKFKLFIVEMGHFYLLCLGPFNNYVTVLGVGVGWSSGNRDRPC